MKDRDIASQKQIFEQFFAHPRDAQATLQLMEMISAPVRAMLAKTVEEGAEIDIKDIILILANQFYDAFAQARLPEDASKTFDELTTYTAATRPELTKIKSQCDQNFLIVDIPAEKIESVAKEGETIHEINAEEIESFKIKVDKYSSDEKAEKINKIKAEIAKKYDVQPADIILTDDKIIVFVPKGGQNNPLKQLSEEESSKYLAQRKEQRNKQIQTELRNKFGISQVENIIILKDRIIGFVPKTRKHKIIAKTDDNQPSSVQFILNDIEHEPLKILSEQTFFSILRDQGMTDEISNSLFFCSAQAYVMDTSEIKSFDFTALTPEELDLKRAEIRAELQKKYGFLIIKDIVILGDKFIIITPQNFEYAKKMDLNKAEKDAELFDLFNTAQLAIHALMATRFKLPKMDKNKYLENIALTLADANTNLFVTAARAFLQDKPDDSLTQNHLKIKNYVTYRILNRPLLQDRIEEMENWVTVLENCIAQKDFHSAYAIFCGIKQLDSLPATRYYLSIEAKKKLNDFQKLVSQWEKDPKKYWKMFKNTDEANKAIPPIIVTDQLWKEKSKEKVEAIKEYRKQAVLGKPIYDFMLMKLIGATPAEVPKEWSPAIDAHKKEEQDFFALQKMSEDEYLESAAESIAQNSRKLVEEEAKAKNSQQITNFVIDQIVMRESMRDRVEAMEKWIKIMDKCFEKNDKHGALAIYNGIQYLTSRLHGTRDGLSSEAESTLVKFSGIAKGQGYTEKYDGDAKETAKSNPVGIINQDLIKRINRTPVKPKPIWNKMIAQHKKEENTLWSYIANRFSQSVVVRIVTVVASIITLGIAPAIVMAYDKLKSNPDATESSSKKPATKPKKGFTKTQRSQPVPVGGTSKRLMEDPSLAETVVTPPPSLSPTSPVRETQNSPASQGTPRTESPSEVSPAASPRVVGAPTSKEEEHKAPAAPSQTVDTGPTNGRRSSFP